MTHSARSIIRESAIRLLNWLTQSGRVPVTDDDLVNELANVLADPDEAHLVVVRAGFSSGRTPPFRIPIVFWGAVVSAARHGAIKGKVQALAEAASHHYPGNETFDRYRSQG